MTAIAPPTPTETTAFDLIAQLLSAPDPVELADRVVAAAVRLTAAEGGSLLLPEPGGELVVRHAWSRDGQARLGRRFARGDGVAGWVAEHNEPVLLNSARGDPRFRSLSPRSFVQALLAVPFLLPDGRGVISLYARHPDAFAPRDLELLRQYGLVAALLVTRAAAQAEMARERARLALALSMCREVLQTADFEAQVRAVCAAIAGHLGFSRCSIGMVSEDGSRVRGVAAHGLPASYIRVSDTPVADLPGCEVNRAIGRCARRGETVLCRDRNGDPAYRAARANPDPVRVFADEYVCIPLRAHGATVGVITISPLAGEGTITAEMVATLEAFAGLVALTILQARTEQATRDAYREILASLAAVVETRDAYTGMHAENVLAYATALARALDLPAAEIEGIQLGAILHDIGKIGIADLILRKPGRLEGAEVDEMHRHATIGGVLLANAHYLRAARAVVEHHHEQWDGGGYPGGLAGDAIPLPAQVVAIADAYDAMTTTRPYRERLPAAEAAARLRAGAGSQFNPKLVELFLGLLEREAATPEHALAEQAEGGLLKLVFTGALTLEAGRELLERVTAWLGAQPHTVIIDLVGATELTDPGIWMLLRIAARCEAQGGALLVAGDPGLRERLPLRVVTPADADRFVARHRAGAAGYGILKDKEKERRG